MERSEIYRDGRSDPRFTGWMSVAEEWHVKERLPILMLEHQRIIAPAEARIKQVSHIISVIMIS